MLAVEGKTIEEGCCSMCPGAKRVLAGCRVGNSISKRRKCKWGWKWEKQQESSVLTEEAAKCHIFISTIQPILLCSIIMLFIPRICSCFTGSCISITYSQCQMLPYNHTTLTPVLSIVKSIEMEKFLKFFGYLNRLSCYQHIMLFGCSLALPECISDGDDRYLGTKMGWLELTTTKYWIMAMQPRVKPYGLFYWNNLAVDDSLQQIFAKLNELKGTSCSVLLRDN